LLQDCAADLTRDSATPRVLAVTAMGGSWGRHRTIPGAEAAAGCHGLLRTVSAECPGVRAAVLDVDETLPAESLAHLIAQEYVSGRADREVGYVDGKRVVYVVEPAPLAGGTPATEWKPETGWVVLVTGGTGGIVGEVCRDLAAPGVRLVLVGRRAGGDGLPPDRRRCMDELRAAGADVEYHAVDVRQSESFGALLDDLYARFGRIDAVIHAAGVVEDQRFDTKSADQFDRVFDTKATGALVLAKHVRPDSLRWIVLFSSVSGRFGNRGQADYAAANETLNRLAWLLHRRWPRTRVVSINWGPWRGAGMADETVRMLLAARGIRPIDVEAGRRFFVDELSFGAPSDVEVVAGDGPWAGETEGAYETGGAPADCAART
jgi:NAD(P)-dependent dehydrogenase (short-subunit alcohol dehydrogenase family)